MKQFFHNISIQTKLTLVIMLSCTILLVIISSIVLVAEIYTSYTTQLHELRILSKSITASSRQPLVLEKYAVIDTQLSTLIHQENIHAAYVFDANGTPVAEYLQQNNSQFVLRTLRSDFSSANKELWQKTSTEKHLLSVRHLSMFTPIFYEGQRIGTLYLMSDLHRLYGRLSGVTFGMTLALMVMTFLAWFLAAILHKPVSVPLLQLSHLMEEVSQSQNYSLRAQKSSGDEIGKLVDGFNRMLEQIESHQKERAQYQEHLERVVTDRTADLRLAVADLELARQHADAANQAKSQFLSRMTHELRTPLIGVLGMNELLARTPLDDQQRLFVDTVQKSGEQLLNLIGDILDLSRIEAGKLQLETGSFDFPQLVAHAVELLIPQAQEKGVLLHYTVAESVPRNVSGDEVRVRQILMNLVGNAIKFTSVGEIRVVLDCHAVESDTADFTLEVIDSGCGMTEETRHQVFDMFYQGSEDSCGSRNGTGLGLAIVQQLVDLMGGKIHLSSVVGQGSCFRISLPLPIVDPSSIDSETC